MNNYISLEEFVKQCIINGIKTSAETIKRRYKEIPGIEKESDYRVLKGTRYPVEKKFKIKNEKDRRYHFLKAFYCRRYIDAEILGIYQNEFELLIKEMLEVGYIAENDSFNTYGSNKYTITQLGINVMDLGKTKAVVEIGKAIAEITGTFTGTVISKVKQ